VHGSLEALTDSISGLPSHEVRVSIVSSGVGSVNESDIELAAATGGILSLCRTSYNTKNFKKPK
jgi:translation initiation factor IF-2